MKVLDVCINNSLLYSGETWGNKHSADLEMLHRRSIRNALDVRGNTNNEIIYIESGRYPLKCEILPRQVKFWQSLIQLNEGNPDYYLGKLIVKARQHKINYIAYYDKLVETYTDSANCKRTLMRENYEKWTLKINNSFLVDKDSKLSTYKSVNPELTSYVKNNLIIEYERELITRYRCGEQS